jgi:hypothetical protein
MEEIFTAIPIFRYACDAYSIGKLDNYEIDEKVQLVCKYLQAHHSKKLHPEMSNRSKYSKNIWHDN